MHPESEAREDHKSSVGCQTTVGKPSYLFYIYDPGVLKPLMNQIKSLGKREVVKTEKGVCIILPLLK